MASPVRYRHFVGRIGVRLWGPVIFGALISLVVVTAIAWVSADGQRRQAATLQREVAQRVVSQLEQYVREFRDDVTSLVSALPLIGADEDAQRSLLKSVTSNPNSPIFRVSIVGLDGIERVKAIQHRPRPIDVEDLNGDPAFESARAGRVYFGPVYISEFNLPALNMAVPIRDPMGNVMAVLRAEIDLSTMWSLVNASTVGQQGYVYVVGGDGNLLAYRDVQRLKDSPLIIGLPQVAEALESESLLPTAREYATGLEGVPVLVSYQPVAIEQGRWIVIVEQPLDDAYAQANTFGLIGLGLAGGTLAAIFIVGLYIRHRIARPIEALRAGAAALAAGNLNYRIHVDTGDELQFLAEEFNAMSATLQQSQTRLANLARERGRQAEDAQARLREMTALIQAGRAITSLDLKDVLSRLAYEAARAVQADRCSIYVADSKQRRFVLRGEWPSPATEGSPRPEGVGSAVEGDVSPAQPSGDLRPRGNGQPGVEPALRSPRPEGVGSRSPAKSPTEGSGERSEPPDGGRWAAGGVAFEWGEGIVGWIAREDKPIFLANAQADKRFTLKAPNDRDIAALIGVPVHLDDALVGVLQASTRPGSPAFDPGDQRLLITFANQAAAAIKNASLYEVERRRAQEMTIVAEIIRTISSSLDLDATLNSILSSVRRLIAYDLAEITLWDAQAEVLRTRGRGADPRYDEYSRTAGGLYHLGQGITGWIASHRAPLLVPDIAAGEVRPAIDQEQFPIRSVVGVPLLSAQQLIGTLELAAYLPGAFNESHLDTLRTVAAQAAVAIQNAQLYLESRRRAEESAGLFRVASIAASVLEPNEILRQIMAEASSLMGAQLGVVLLVNPDTQLLEVHPTALFGAPYESVLDFKIDTRKPTFHHSVTRSRRVFRTDDALSDRRILKDYRPFVERFGVRRVVSAPLLVRDQPIGEIHIIRTTGGPFDSDDEQRLLTLATLLGGVVETARLAMERAERFDELAGLYEISQAVSALTDLQQVYSQITRSIAERVGVEFAGVLLYDAESQALVSQPPFYGVPDEVLQRYIIPVAPGSPAHRLWSERDTWFSNDVPNDALTQEAGLAELARTVGVQRTLLAVMTAGTRRIGVIQVSNKVDGQPFTEHDARLMSIYATQIAAVVENARLYALMDARLQQRVEELAALSAISQELNATLELERILGLVLGEAVRAASAPRGAVVLVEPATQELIFRALFGYTPEEVERARLMRLRVGDGILGKVIQAGEPLRVDDVRSFGLASHSLRSGTSQDMAHPDTIHIAAETQSVLCVPIRYALEVVGAINLESPLPTHFTPEHVAFCNALAAQAAIAIGNAQRFEEQLRRGELLRHRAEQLANLFEIGQAFRSDRPLSEVLDEVVHAVQATAGYSIVLLSLLDDDAERPMLQRVAAAGLPVAKFEEMKTVRTAWETVSNVMHDVFRISQSYYIPAEYNVVTRDLDTWPPFKAWEAVLDAERPSGRWHEQDLLLTPLRGSGDRILGIMSVDQPFDGRIPERPVVETLELFANQAAIAVENARLLADLQQRIDSLLLFNQVSRTLSARLDLDGLLGTIVDASIELIGCPRATVFLRDATSGRFAPRKSRGFELERIAHLSWAEGEGLVGAVARDGQPLIVPDLQAWSHQRTGTTSQAGLEEGQAAPSSAADSRTAQSAQRETPAARGQAAPHVFDQPASAQFDQSAVPDAASILLVPIAEGGHVIGVLSVDQSTPRAFSNTDLLLLSTLADQAAVAIQNTQLLAETQRRLLEQTVLYESSRDLALAHDARGAIAAVTERMLRHLGATALCYYTYDDANDTIQKDYEYWTPYAIGHERRAARVLGEVSKVEPDFPHLATALRSRTPQTLKRGDPSLTPAERDMLIAYDGQTVIAVPMAARDRVLGYFEIWECQPERDYDEADQRLMLALATQAGVAVENVRLFEQTVARTRELGNLFEATTAITTSLALDRVLDAVGQQLLRALDVHTVTVTRWDRGHNQVVVMTDRDVDAGHAERSLDAPGTVYSLDTYPGVVQVLEDARPRALRQTDPALDELDRLNLQRLGLKALLRLPLLAQDRVIGMVELGERQRDRTFSPDDIRLAQTLTSQAAIAITNAELFAETQRRVAELQSINAVSQAITATMPLSQLLELIRREVGRVIDTSSFYIALHDVAADTITFPLFYDHGTPISVEPIPGEAGVTGYIFNTRKPLLLNTPADVLALGIQSLGEESQSYVGVPMMVGGFVSGVMAVQDYERPYAYDEGHVRILSTLAAQAAVAIENARLFEETQRRLHQQALFYEAGRAISASLEYTAVLETAAAQLLRVTGVQGAILSEWDSYHDRLTVVLSKYQDMSGIGSPDASGRVYPLADYPHIREALGDREVLLMRHDDPALNRNERTALERTGFFYALMVPMIARDQVLGSVWLVDARLDRAFSETDQRLIATLVNQIAAAVVNARLFDQVRRFTQELEERVRQRTDELAMANTQLTLERDRVETLYRITSELSASLDLDRVLNRALALVNDAVGTTRSSILMVDPETGVLLHRAALGRRQPLPSGGRPTRFQRDQGLAGWVIRNRLPAIIPDIQLDDRWQAELDTDSLHGLHGRTELGTPAHSGRGQADTRIDQSAVPTAVSYRSALAVPLIAGDDALGALLLLHPDEDYFAESHLRLVEAAATQVATAINNAALYGFIRESAERLGAMLRDKQIEAAKAQAILESVADGVLVTDATDAIILFNAAAERILGRARQSVLNRPTADVIGLYGAVGAHWEERIHRWRGEPQARREVPSLSNRIQFEDEKRFVNVSIAPVTGPGEEFLGTVSVFRDITAEVEADRAKSKFVSDVSHELRTPMTSIKGYADLLLLGAAGSLNENQDRFLGIIKANADRLSVLVDDLLDISRFETGRAVLDIKQVSMAAVIEQVLNTLHERIEQKGLTLRADLPEGDPLDVVGDHARLIQILTNLVGNAYQYTPPGGTITVRAHPTPAPAPADSGRGQADSGRLPPLRGEGRWQAADDMLCVEVHDTGIGIAPEDAAKVFDRFFRADHPTVQEFPGTGLGLSIVKSLVDMHGGEIWVDSVVGQGTTFSFTVPLAEVGPSVGERPEPAAAATLSRAEGPRAVRAEPPRILVVEDEPDIAALIARNLSQVGYAVHTVGSGRAAIESAKGERPDLITLDIYLPDIDGREVLQTLKTDPNTADVPIVVVSVIPDSTESLQLGAIDFLTKPIDSAALIGAVSRVLGQVGSILVVEDDLDTCNLLTEALQRAGFHVLVTSSGRHALSLAKAERPDLILLDLRLPRMDGYTVLQLLKVSPSTANIPVMIMTGSVKMDAVREQEFMALGAASFIAKPFEVEALIAQIESVLAPAREAEGDG